MSGVAPPPGGFSAPTGGYPPPNPPFQYDGPPQPPGAGGYPYPPGGYGGPPYNAGYGPPPTGGYGAGYGPPPQQPPVAWMPRPTVPHCPVGLEYLTQIAQLFIKQKKELTEMFTDIETANRYVCLNTMGQTVYFCKEESDFCTRQCCSANRPFTMHIQDNAGSEVIRINRPYKYQFFCQCCSCSECCQDELEVESPVGQVIGYVKQIHAGCNVRYHILDAERNKVLEIHGPSYCFCPCFGEDIHFLIFSADGSAEIGRITKQWSNVLQEIFTDADNFGVTFPLDLDVRFKAVLIGAVFLIDFMFFENNHKNNDD